jgi:hypothetical protein
MTLMICKGTGNKINVLKNINILTAHFSKDKCMVDQVKEKALITSAQEVISVGS